MLRDIWLAWDLALHFQPAGAAGSGRQHGYEVLHGGPPPLPRK